MKDTAYLVIDAWGIVSMTKRTPKLKGGQHAVKLHVQVADKYFESATHTAKLTIGEEHLISPQIDVKLEQQAPASSSRSV